MKSWWRASIQLNGQDVSQWLYKGQLVLNQLRLHTRHLYMGHGSNQDSYICFIFTVQKNHSGPPSLCNIVEIRSGCFRTEEVTRYKQNWVNDLNNGPPDAENVQGTLLEVATSTLHAPYRQPCAVSPMEEEEWYEVSVECEISHEYSTPPSPVMTMVSTICLGTYSCP